MFWLYFDFVKIKNVLKDNMFISKMSRKSKIIL